MPFIIKLGVLAVHTECSVQASDALASLCGLFEFIQWVDYCYGIGKTRTASSLTDALSRGKRVTNILFLTNELGSKEDYEREFWDTPFGLLVRKIAKLDHEAAMAVFSQVINDQSLNQKQIAFVYKIINHIEQNRYMESVTMLNKPPV